MKKTLIYILTAVAVLGACSRESLDTPKGTPAEYAGITISPVCSRPGTKAEATMPGDPTYNENAINDYFWFIYGDEAGNDLRVCGYEEGSRPRNINLDSEFPTGGTGYAYVVANLPSDKFTFAPAEGESKGGILYDGTIYSTLSEIRSLPIDLTFYNYNETSVILGTVEPGSFVMRTSDPVPFDLEARTNVHVTASLARVSVKVVLNLKVAKEINQMETTPAGLELYKKTWISDVDQIQLYMLWGSTHSTISGTPIEYGDETKDYFYSASPRYAMFGFDVQNGVYASSGYSYTPGGELSASGSVLGNVVGAKQNSQSIDVTTSVWRVAYKVKEDEQGNPIWIWKDGVAAADQTEENKGNFAYGDWDYDLLNGQKQELYDANGNVIRYLSTETVTQEYWAFSSTPLYTTPIQWDVNSAHAPFIKIILPWQGEKRADNGTGEVLETDSKKTKFYYKILLPGRTSLEANNYCRISLDLSVLGSEADDVPIEVGSEYHVVDWNELPENMGGEFLAGRYLNCETSFAFYSQNSMPIPVSSSHEIEVVSSSATYQDYSNETGAVETDLPEDTYTITASGNNLVTIKHTMETDLSKMANYDVSPITYTLTLQHEGEGGSTYKKTITVVQYPSLYVKAELNSNYLLGTNQTARDRYKGYVYVNNGQNTSSSNWYYTGGLYGSSGNQNPNMYVITTTVVDPSLDYVLGDPRVDEINNLGFNFESAPCVEGGNRRLLYYYPTDSDNSKRHFISPSYRIVSSYGRFGGAKSLELAQRRCAAYQEDGYPAGRWRLPTEAELEYITTLSAKGRIPTLFNSGGTYWSAQSAVTVNENGTVSISNATTAFARCVYDEWYWGSETVTKTTFTWGDAER